jgi:hypothetical protein
MHKYQIAWILTSKLSFNVNIMKQSARNSSAGYQNDNNKQTG